MKSNKSKGGGRSAVIVLALVLISSAGLLGVIALGYFFGNAPPEEHEAIPIAFYFQNNIDNSWEYEIRQLDFEPNLPRHNVVARVLNHLQEGPQSSALLPSLAHVEIISASLHSDEMLLEVFLSDGFINLEPMERTIALVSMVYTLTGLPFISDVYFLVGDEPLLSPDGSPFGARNRDNTQMAQDSQPMLTEEATIILFFPDEQMMGLISEERTISINPLQVIEQFIMDALIEGPYTEGLYPSFPPDTLYNRIERAGDTLIVDFPDEFIALLPGGSTAEEMMLLSLVNTFTEKPEIARIQILIDGLIPTSDEGFHFDLSQPLERDESLIITPE